MVTLLQFLLTLTFLSVCANSNEDALFYSSVVTSTPFSSSLTRSNEDDLFLTPLPTAYSSYFNTPTSEDILFSHSVPDRSFVGFLKKKGEYVNNTFHTLKHNFQHTPELILGAGLTGAFAGYHYGKVWNKAYIAGLDLLHKKPLIAQKIPQGVVSLLHKGVRTPQVQRARIIYYIGEFCVLTSLYATKNTDKIKGWLYKAKNFFN